MDPKNRRGQVLIEALMVLILLSLTYVTVLKNINQYQKESKQYEYRENFRRKN